MEITQQLTETQRGQELLHIQRAACLEEASVGFSTPTGPSGEATRAINPFPARHVESLVRPFSCNGKVLHFIRSPLQSACLQRGFRSGRLEAGKIAGELYLDRRSIVRKPELSQFVCHSLDKTHSLAPLFF